MEKIIIPVSAPVIGKNAQKYLNECLSSTWISSRGMMVSRFEQAFAKFVGTRYAVATNSGTSALHLALATLKIGSGDEVIVPAFTMIASVLPILYVGAKPVLVDAEWATGNIDVNLVKKKINKKTKALMIVHIGGHPVNMESLVELGVPIIEDAAEAHGAKVKIKNTWKSVGSVGEMGCFSFYANKIITSGEGGMITTNNKQLADRARHLQNLARTPGRHFYHQEIAFAYRLSALEAALGLAQLEEADRFFAKKSQIATQYVKLLGKISELELPVEESYAKRLHWHFEIRLKTRDALALYLAKRGVETRKYFVPMHLQPAFKKQGLFKGEHYPVAEKLSKYGLCLPSGLAMTNDQIKYVSEAIIHYFR